MDLSNEDSFRLNVLLANRPQAIRIDESKLIVYGLGPQGEATVRLNPNARPDQYLRRVKELISGHVLGSPGGYPIYLSRWTRMGQMRDESLEQLLLLGEPEAVVAAVCSPGLTDELARRAWWAMDDAENARRMLGNPAIVAGAMGRILVDYLVDYLPFETESDKMTESIRLILRTGLLDTDRREDLWKKAARKQVYLVGFLQAVPDDLPGAEGSAARPLPEPIVALAATGNPCARLLGRVFSSPGQTFLATVATVLSKPPGQDVVTATFDLLRDYFGALRPEGDPDLPLSDLIAEAEHFATPTSPDPDTARLLSEHPEMAPEVAAMRTLSGVGYGLIRAVAIDPSVLGSLMRRKLTPVIDPLLVRLGLLARRR
ncbi:MAG: sulfur reduction protein DsrS [Thiocapsa sp.]|uniref:sulfur reduction protein DsrS n=1 Tax=Thiocapsa sp. TaxID=2024551 RepID=UPI001BCFE807|nr:sulfur reduction protein DsrS [Thiocapsa sp.]QVL50806.1 MAG: sulfur reduction protein DsrS [Thiocapsa sp.]